MVPPTQKEPVQFVAPPTREDAVARADALRKKLGRELRTEIEWPLTEEEWEEKTVALIEKSADEWDPKRRAKRPKAAAESPDADPESVKADAVPLDAELRGWFVRKYRRPRQDEWRMVFAVISEDEVFVLSLDQLGDNRKTAARRARRMKHLRGV